MAQITMQSIADLAERVVAFTKEHYDMKAIDFGKLKDRDYILTHATLAICNTHGNEKMLAPLVHEQVPGTDLTVYPCINIGHGSAKAVREYIESLGIQPSEILASAALNSRKEYTVRKMRDVMAEMMGIAPEEVPDMNMVVVSNQEGVNGAAAISDPETMDMVTELLKAEEFCIIPSSIHEIICIPSETADEYTIQSMITQVNEHEVHISDQLSAHPYYYNSRTQSLQMHPSHTETHTRQPAGRIR